MIRGAVLANFKSNLILWQKEWGNMTARGYQEHVLPDLHDFQLLVQQSHDAKVLVMQDNAPIHTAKSTIAWLKENGLVMFHWTLSSPDMNPIEKDTSNTGSTSV